MTPTKTCLDAETLAAWVDGGLDARAAAMAEAHVSSCPRCQEIASLVIKTTPVEPAKATLWSSLRAGWLIPLAASVAAVGIWMIVPTDRATAPPAPTAVVAETKVAQAPTAEQAQPADQLNRAAPAAPAEEFRAKEKQQGTRAREFGAKNEAAASAKATAGQAQLAKDADAKRFDEAKADTNADANKLRDQFSPVPPAVAPAAASAKAPAERATAVSAAPAASAMEAGRLEAQAPARQGFAQAAAAREARSPDGSIRWRLTSTNTLERSTDSGQTWVPVETGAGGPLASIQVTDVNIATVTTVDGRQFRTTDSGKTWRVFP